MKKPKFPMEIIFSIGLPVEEAQGWFDINLPGGASRSIAVQERGRVPSDSDEIEPPNGQWDICCILVPLSGGRTEVHAFCRVRLVVHFFDVFLTRAARSFPEARISLREQLDDPELARLLPRLAAELAAEDQSWPVALSAWTSTDPVALPWHAWIQMSLEDVTAACYEHLERVAGKRFPAEWDVGVMAYTEQAGIALRYDISSVLMSVDQGPDTRPLPRRTVGHVRIRRISAQQTRLEVSANVYGDEADASRLREIVAVFFGRWLADLEATPPLSSPVFMRSPAAHDFSPNIIRTLQNATAQVLPPGEHGTNVSKSGPISLQRKPPGRPTEPQNDVAFQKIIEGERSKESYDAAFDYWCKAKGIKKPNKYDRNAFKKAMDRAESRFNSSESGGLNGT